MVAKLAVYCFFSNKPQVLDGYYILKTLNNISRFDDSYPELGYHVQIPR